MTTLPLRLAETSPRPSLTAACGQFVVVRRDALERAGGVAAIRGAVLDDIALVRAIKAAGGRGGFVDGTDLASCRMYAGWPELRAGYGKSLWAAFGSGPRAAAVLALLGTATASAVTIAPAARVEPNRRTHIIFTLHHQMNDGPPPGRKAGRQRITSRPA